MFTILIFYSGTLGSDLYQMTSDLTEYAVIVWIPASLSVFGTIIRSSLEFAIVKCLPPAVMRVIV